MAQLWVCVCVGVWVYFMYVADEIFAFAYGGILAPRDFFDSSSPLTSPDIKNTHGTTVRTQFTQDHDRPTTKKSEDVSSETLTFIDYEHDVAKTLRARSEWSIGRM